MACAMCELPFQLNIYLCKSGHSFCAKCTTDVKVCNLCQEKILYRNIAAENFIRMLSSIQPELKDEQSLEKAEDTKIMNGFRKCPFCYRQSYLADTNFLSHLEIEHRVNPVKSAGVIKCVFSGTNEKKAYEIKNLKIFLKMYNTTNINTRLKFINYSENEYIRIKGEIGRTKLDIHIAPNGFKVLNVEKGRLECCFTVDEINTKTM